MQKITTFTTNFRVKKCYFHYDKQNSVLSVVICDFFLDNHLITSSCFKSTVHCVL
jgi:hypothetical protein